MIDLLKYVAVAMLGGTVGALGMALACMAGRCDEEGER